MNCVDCGDPAVAGERRCPECLEEVRESPNWHQGPRSTGRVKPPPEDKACPACQRPLRPERRGKWCAEACRAWAREHPGEVRVDPNCRGCGRQFRPLGADKWCSSCRSSTLTCEQCHQLMPWRLSGGELARYCSTSCAGARRKIEKPACSEPECGRPSRSRGLCKTHYNKKNGHYVGDVAKDPDRERARLRLKTHRRHDWMRLTDITPEYEMSLRAKAKRCPCVRPNGEVCGVKLTDAPFLPNSKELDHIVPQGAGGTHTMGNVRIICRDCNLGRPHDGSDYSGPVTLWAQVG